MQAENLEELRAKQFQEELENRENYQALVNDKDKLINHVNNLFLEKDLDKANINLIKTAYRKDFK